MRSIALVVTVLVLFTASCVPASPSVPTIDVQAAIEKTFAALPTFTYSPTIEPTSTATETPTPTATTSSPEMASDSGSISDCLPENAHTDLGVVTSVIDGEIFEALINGQTYAIRYIGVNIPPKPKQGEVDNGLWEKAKDFNLEMVENQVITLVKDASEVDADGRLLRYVFVGDTSGIFANYEMIRQGIAHAYPFPPDVACAQTLVRAEQLARQDLLGIWGPSTTPGTLTPLALQSPSPTVSRTPNCHPSYPTLCIPPPPPDLSCNDIPYRDFQVYTPDPHGFDEDNDGIGCESPQSF